MKLNAAQRNVVYSLVGDSGFVYGYHFSKSRKRWAADQYIQAFEDWITRKQTKPTHYDLKDLAIENWEKGHQVTTNGKEVYSGFGFDPLTILLIILIGWIGRKILDYLWNLWTTRKETE